MLALTLTGCGPSPSPDTGAAVPSPSATSDTASPAVPQSGAATATAPAGPPAAPAAALPQVMGSSDPVTLSIPSIGVRTDLLHLGLRTNGALEVPQDTGHGAPASWYNGSPTPGARGPAVILGHVNALGGATGVFAGLRDLEPGSEISISRADGSTAEFTVDRGALYSKNDFPTLEVYGNTDAAELRLITCDGYDPATGLFDDNYVIYATLTP
ncbi:Sortase family protein [Pseudarthrobacter equi]|uniref:Sortase family protein n=1 Tax=Pseudarthrobacter equi TaxID=728066 RepID=A0A1H1YLT6_9MICC|nr:Sortase family protein [Pseudarthrobacter equi]